MRIATVQIDSRRRPGVVCNDNGEQIIELFSSAEDLRALIQRGGIESEAREAPCPLAPLKLCAPLDNPGKLLCLASNYREHIIEAGWQAPAQDDIVTPQVFLKPATSLTGDRDPIPIRDANVAVGWEMELAVVIGRRGRDISAAEALDYVFGYTIINDISERRLNSTITGRWKREYDPFFDWLAGKWFDGFAPCGPWVVTADEIRDPHSLGLRLWVNGELRQDGNTAAMMARIPEQISYISSIMTLEPGDIIATGTPAGAGLGSGDKSLHDGDEVVCEIDGIGRLQNRVCSFVRPK